MARSKSSNRWLEEHVNDPFVKQAQQDGYRSRASYKLLEINNKDRLIKPTDLVVDLGSAPGGWSQVAAKLVGHKGRVVASSLFLAFLVLYFVNMSVPVLSRAAALAVPCLMATGAVFCYYRMISGQEGTIGGNTGGSEPDAIVPPYFSFLLLL